MKNISLSGTVLLAACVCLPTAFAQPHLPLESSIIGQLSKYPTLSEKQSAFLGAYSKLRRAVLPQAGYALPDARTAGKYGKIIAAMEKLSIPVSTEELKNASSREVVAQGTASVYAIANESTPVLYRPDFSSVFGTETGTGLLLDEYGQIDPLEYVALRNTVFHVSEILIDKGNPILKVSDPNYPYENDGKGYYVDARFVSVFLSPVAQAPKSPERAMPMKSEIESRLLRTVGLPYVWGGNAPEGIPEMLDFYGPTAPADQALANKWTMRGVDCSWLLYYATEGATPRNTSDLVKYGTGVSIVGKTAEEISRSLKPLDIIAWKGHTIVVLDSERTIESANSFPDGTPGFENGVKIRELKSVLEDVMTKRVPVDSIDDAVPEGKKKFVVRRWIEDGK